VLEGWGWGHQVATYSAPSLLRLRLRLRLWRLLRRVPWLIARAD
jgi:hypothetical protein